jgi:putative restriction endonuclease
LLLAAHLDAAFDAGLISFSDEGQIIFSSRFRNEDREVLGLSDGLRLRKVTPGHLLRLVWHRENLLSEVGVLNGSLD